MEHGSCYPAWLYERMSDNPAVRICSQNRGSLPLSSIIQEALVIAQSYKEKKRGILVVKQSLYQAQLLYERLSVFLSQEECALFGADESLRVETIASSPEMTAMKVETMASLLNHPDQVVVTCPSALIRFLPLPEDFLAGCVDIHTGMQLNMNELKRILVAGGYRQTSHIDQPLTFACRGGIVDVYSINYENPIRIEFFDTEVDSIRFFDPSTQKTVSTTDDVRIVPATDVLFTDDQKGMIREATEHLYARADKKIPGEIETDLADIDAGIFENRLYPYMALLKECAGIWDYMDHPVVIWSDRSTILENIRAYREDCIAYIQEMVSEGDRKSTRLNSSHRL